MSRLIALLVLFVSWSGVSQTHLIHNVKGYTYLNSGESATFSQLVFTEGKVLEFGHDLIDNYPEAVVLDGNGRTLLPGLVDGHGHFQGLGFNLLNVDVRDIKSAQLTAQKVAQYAKQNQRIKWIKGRGWNQVLWPGKAFPTARDLDELISDRPVVLDRVDGHAIWVNSKAMALAGIDRNTVSPKGGEIVKDEKGNPTGVFIDNAEYLIKKKIPAPTIAETIAAYEKATSHLLSLGITSMHDAGDRKSTRLNSSH